MERRKVNKKTENIIIRVEPEYKQMILKYCYEHNVNITDVVIESINKTLKNENKE